MYMRTFSICVSLALITACGKPDNEVLAEAESRAAAQAADDGKIECAINGDTEFTKGCETERLASEDGVTMIVRHPDGGFRRLKVLTDGRGLAAADGAEQAKISIIEDGKILVSVGQDKYIMPAKVKTSAKPEATMAIPSTEKEAPVQAAN